MSANANVGTTNLNNKEKWLAFDVNDGRESGGMVYVSATDITMVHQDAALNTATYIFYKSGTGTSTIKIVHPADSGKLLVDDIYKAIFKLNSLEKQVTTEVTSTIVPTGIKTGCDICPTTPVKQTVTTGVIDPSIEITELSITGTKAFSLADGAQVGDRISIMVVTAESTPAGTLTPATTSGAYATIAFNKVGQTVDLQWAGTTGWAVMGRTSGAVAAAGVVADLPVLA
jgi:hypothetical protein